MLSVILLFNLLTVHYAEVNPYESLILTGTKGQTIYVSGSYYI